MVKSLRFARNAALSAALLAGLVFVPVAARAETVTGFARVLDATTLVIEGQAFRLKWVVAPKLGDEGGSAAAAALMRIVADRIVTCHIDGQRTVYAGMLNAGCETVGVDVAALLVERGHARDCAGPSRGRYRHQEARAVAAGSDVLTRVALPPECQTRRR
jgi:endonuclease YncB( thermonuclease family)